jgi:hypothetical protein
MLLLFYLSINLILPFSSNINFSIYRSICCFYLFTKALLNIKNNSKKQKEKLNKLFIEYLFTDLILMVCLKNTRIDLWIHHIICLIIYKMNITINDHMLNVLLIAEIISIVSGFYQLCQKYDLPFKNNCLIFRLGCIIVVRFPIWIYSIKNFNKLKLKKKNFIFSSFALVLMILLDIYWSFKIIQKIT